MLLFFLFFSLLFLIIPNRVDAITYTVCAAAGAGCDHVGSDGIQKAINEAHDGDTILIKGGTYTSAVTGTCAIDSGAKKLTIKGESDSRGGNGTMLFGEGHDKPDVYPNRAAVCVNGGELTIDDIHLKEFQGGAVRATNSRLILKNNVIDGHDSGAIHLYNSSVLAVNNYFVANSGGGALIPFGNSPIKAFNNTFYDKALNAECGKDLPAIDFVNNIVVDIELTVGAGGIFGDCPATVTQFKNKHIAYNLIWKNRDNTDHPCYPNHEYCDSYTGKISADPMLNVPAIDQRGWRWGGDFSPQDGSPVIGAGDPAVLGTKNLGATGGPCATPNTATCQQFITDNWPPAPQPPEPPPQPPGNNGNNAGNNGNNTGYTVSYVPKNTIYDFNFTLKSVLNLPKYFSLTSADTTKNDRGLTLIMYIVFAAVYIMFTHFAIGIKNEFNIFLMVIYFVLGGFVGGWFHSYEAGLALSIILSLIFF